MNTRFSARITGLRVNGDSRAATYPARQSRQLGGPTRKRETSRTKKGRKPGGISTDIDTLWRHIGGVESKMLGLGVHVARLHQSIGHRRLQSARASTIRPRLVSMGRTGR